LPAIDVKAGNPQFQLDVNLNANTTVDVAVNSTLTFDHQLNLMGFTFTNTGVSRVAIDNKLTEDHGVVTVEQGTISGDGTISDDVINNRGIISPGNKCFGASTAIPELSTFILSLVAALSLGNLWLGRNMYRQWS